MKRIFSSAVLLALTGSQAMGGGNIAPDEPIVAEKDTGEKWQYSVSLYLWTASIRGETRLGWDADIGFRDIMSNLDFTFMGNLAAQKGKWGIAVDIIYLAVENNPNMQLPYGAVLRNVQIRNWIVTPTVSYQIVKSDEWTLALFGGARYFSIEPKFTISPFPEQSISGNIWDGIIGVKGKVDLEGNWSVPYHFDIGTGECDLTWQAFAGVGYEYVNIDIAVGYRHLEWDFSKNKHGGGLFKDLSVSGPIVGAKYRF